MGKVLYFRRKQDKISGRVSIIDYKNILNKPEYDFINKYVRNKNFYLSLRENKDFIDWELNEVLDINGWDLKKALKHFHKSNATLFEWSNSPIVYYTTDEWKELYDRTA